VQPGYYADHKLPNPLTANVAAAPGDPSPAR